MCPAAFRPVLLLTICLIGGAANGADDSRPNVLFIAVDDLRPELACYGVEHIRTPHIDRLASRGTVFDRAYCMVPVCGASRASLMTGIRPSRNRFVHWQASAEKEAPGITTLNTHFKDQGYRTVSLGKIFNNPGDSAAGWSEREWRPSTSAVGYHLSENQKLFEERQKQGAKTGGILRGPSYEVSDISEDEYWDGLVARRAVDDLRRLAGRDQPFFLAVGFIRPHLPFVAPRKYWDWYDRKDIRLPSTYRLPANIPKEAIYGLGELRQYVDVPPRPPLTDEHARALIHGYYASVSHVDAQIGKVLAELEHLELDGNTIVVLWGDHGWSLGEHSFWSKATCFETSMHAPLIVAAPGFAGGQTTRGITEFIDIYPSLCELAGLPLPEHLDGQSFVPLMRDPRREGKKTAIGRIRNGDTIRTDRYRFTEYTREDGTVQARMLYDHETDPREMVNLSEDSRHLDIVTRLTEALHSGKGVNGKPGSGHKTVP